MTSFVHRNIPQASVLKLFFFVGLVWAALAGPLSGVLVLVHNGATNQHIGIISAISSFAGMIVQPVWGFISDKIGSPRKVLCIGLCASTVCFTSVLFTDNLYLVSVLLVLEVMFRSSVVALLDSHTLSEIGVMPGLQYGHIRMAGSIFFGVISFMYSFVINERDIMAVIPISAAIAVVAVCWGFFIARGRWETSEESVAGVRRIKPSLKKDTAALFQNKPYIMLLFFAALASLSSMPLLVFLIEFAVAVGTGPGQVPLILALRCAIEVPVLIFIGTKAKRISAKKLMLTGACLMVIYVIGLLFSTSFIMLVVSHVVGGAPGFIFLLAGRLRYLNEITPESVRSTSITLMGTSEWALGAIAGSLIGGFVLEAYGTHALALISLIAILAAMFILVLIPTKT